METNPRIEDEIMEKARRCDQALFALNLMTGNKVWDLGKLQSILEGKA